MQKKINKWQEQLLGGGAMWSKEDKLEQVKCVIPDRSYSTMYQAILEDCR